MAGAGTQPVILLGAAAAAQAQLVPIGHCLMAAPVVLAPRRASPEQPRQAPTLRAVIQLAAAVAVVVKVAVAPVEQAAVVAAQLLGATGRQGRRIRAVAAEVAAGRLLPARLDLAVPV